MVLAHDYPAVLAARLLWAGRKARKSSPRDRLAAHRVRAGGRRILALGVSVSHNAFVRPGRESIPRVIRRCDRSLRPVVLRVRRSESTMLAAKLMSSLYSKSRAW